MRLNHHYFVTYLTSWQLKLSSSWYMVLSLNPDLGPHFIVHIKIDWLIVVYRHVSGYCSSIGYTLKIYKESSCLIYLICFCLRIVLFNTYCVVFLFCLSPLPFSLDCPSILIAPSVFSNVYLYSILSSVHNSDASVFLYFTF